MSAAVPIVTKSHGLEYGTYFFIGICLIGAIIIGEYVVCATRDKDPVVKAANRRLAWGLTFLGSVMMWGFWACVYMHQMYPLILPDIEKK